MYNNYVHDAFGVHVHDVFIIHVVIIANSRLLAVMKFMIIVIRFFETVLLTKANDGNTVGYQK